MLHTGGWNKERNDIGPVTITRAKKALEIWGMLPEATLILITAGSRGSGSNKPICEMARDWFVKQDVPNRQILTPQETRADNTIAETIEAVKNIEEVPLNRSLYVISSWSHINPRLRIIWRKYGEGIKPRFVAADGRWTGFKDHFLELRGTLAVLLGRTGPRYTQL